VVYKELRRLWRERSTLSLDQLIKRLIEFAKSHPYPLSATPEVVGGIAPEREEDLECIAWMKVF
jgi:hypothetical protein